MKINTLISLTTLTVTLLIGCSKSDDAVSPAHWDYENTDWQAEGYTDCAGKVQSPIDIDTTLTVKSTLPSIQLNYAAFPLKIVDNGHTIQVVGDGKSTMTYNNTVFTLKQFHFHYHSEHTINGKSAPMEVHFVHEDAKTGNLMVLGVLLEAGATNNLIDQLWNNIPKVKEQETTVNSVTVDPLLLLPANRKYYQYTGSLTTPPCSQGLNWVVFKNRVKMSSAQLTTFGTLYNHNYRPAQATNNRPVLESL